MLKKVLIILPLLNQMVHAAERCPTALQRVNMCGDSQVQAENPKVQTGIILDRETKGTLLGRVGLQKEDVIIGINGKSLKEMDKATLLDLKNLGADEGMALQIIRPGVPTLSGELDINLFGAQNDRKMDHELSANSTRGGLFGGGNPNDLVSSGRKEGDSEGRTRSNISESDRDGLINGLIVGLADQLFGKGPKEIGPRGGDIGVIETPHVPSTPREPSEPNTPEGPKTPENPSTPEPPETPSTPETPENPETGEDPQSGEEPTDGEDGGTPTPDPDDDFMPADPDGNFNDTGHGRSKGSFFRHVVRIDKGPWINPKRDQMPGEDVGPALVSGSRQGVSVPLRRFEDRIINKPIQELSRDRLGPLVNPVRNQFR